MTISIEEQIKAVERELALLIWRSPECRQF